MADLPMQLDRRHNIDLERRSAERYARRVVLGLLLATVVAALVGVFGQSPASSSVVGAGQTRLSLSAPEGLRAGSSTRRRSRFGAPGAEKGSSRHGFSRFEGITL